MENLKAGIVLFGGSFDPVQKSHADIIKNLSERFERTIVVPSYISPFKKGERAADGALRMKMLTLALPKSKNIEITPFELESGGVSYTIETVLHFKELYKNNPCYFAIGTDMLAGLPRWHRIDELKELVTFYVIGRPGFLVKDAVVRKLLKLGIRILFSDFTGGGASSSQAKLDIAFGKYDLVPAQAVKIIQTNGLYRDYDSIVSAYPRFHLSAERIGHIYRTATAAIQLAKIHKVSVSDAILAALLHDIAKSITGEELRAMGVEVSDDEKAAPEKVRHAFWGARVAKTLFQVKKKAVLDAIYFHTTGAPKMGKLSKVIFLADLCEDGRDEYADLAEIRELSVSNLNAAMLLALKGLIARLNQASSPVYHLTRDAYEFYGNQSQNKRPATLPQKAEADKRVLTRLAPQPAAAGVEDARKLARTIAELLDEKKARDITLINLSGKTIVADYFVIATVGSTTAVRALTDYVDESLSKKMGIEPLRRDLDAKWAAIDYGSIILHIQTDDVRNFYDLERLWNDGTNTERFN